VWRYSGRDGIDRSLVVRIRPEPTQRKTDQVCFLMKIPSRGRKQLRITFHIAERKHQDKAALPKRTPWNMERKQKDLQASMRQWLRKGTQVQSNSLLLGRALERSLIDLCCLRSKLNHKEFFAAGTPWFATLFGRDSLFACIQTLAFRSDISRQTLELLAQKQGREIDDWRAEEPGKILHELRAGELANTRKIPHTPYYGTVDATPLFLILLGLYSNWTGDLSLFRKLRSNVQAALKWIDRDTDLNGTGFVQYDSPADSDTGHLANQGWKDSGNAIVNNDGTIATPPIALVEVQAYVYQAKKLIAQLCQRAGDRDLCRTLRQQAKALETHFNRKFWSNKLSTYFLALQKGGQPAQVISSNAGHALWCGIGPKSKAEKVVKSLMSEEMFTGWGVRTLAETEKAYNPIGYHMGSVWPHDNSILFAGFRRYGFDAEAMTILEGMLDAAMHFRHHQLPEVFAGFSKNEFPVPVRYSVACHPQAWAAGSIPFMVSEMLGFQPNALEKQLRIVRPLLPHFLSRLKVLGLKCGDGAADLHFERTSTSKVNVRVLKIYGDLDIVIRD
jgi:glycogen debranching enzyme